MRLAKSYFIVLCFALAAAARAEPAPAVAEPAGGVLESAQHALSATRGNIENLMDRGMNFLGIRYRFGGTGPESGGFDCSGLVRRVFGDALGLGLPRTAAEMAKLGDKVGKSDLKPGDLVFFNTMRRTFSHVGIYLGENRFLHAPSKGGAVRIESMETAYWQKRFNGARRIMPEAEAAQPAAVLPASSSSAPQ
ncbi:MAG: C40 family peptidase [Moraxellaceae bacterium]|nr:C40 family peptidase [Moraxellaceae bacterium]